MIATKEKISFLNNTIVKVRSLMLQYADLQNENIRLKRVLQETKAELDAERQKVASLEEECYRIKVAKVLSVSEDEAKRTRQRLSKIEREIEKCIALLNE